jgi:hypothetical protein
MLFPSYNNPGLGATGSFKLYENLASVFQPLLLLQIFIIEKGLYIYVYNTGCESFIVNFFHL